MLKLGVIGTNWITQQFVEAAKETGRYDLTSVTSRTSAKAHEFGDKNGAKFFYEDLTAMVESGNVDVVYIASPNSLHYQDAVTVISHDLHAIVEKPAVSNQAEMEKLLHFLEQHPTARFFEAARNIHTENFKKIAAQVADMPVIQGASFTYMKYSSRYDAVLAGEEPNVFSPKFSGGALQDLGVYTVYDAVTLFGTPDDVAYYPTFLGNRIDGKGVAILRYPEFDVTLSFGKTSNSYAPSEIFGLKDTIEIDDAGELTQVTYIDEQKQRHELGGDDGSNPMIPEALDFANVIDAPNEADNAANYKEWLSLSVNVNKVLFNLRQSGKLEFPADKQ